MPEMTETGLRAINIEQLRMAQGLLEKYHQGKWNFDNKVIANEDWWKLNHYSKYPKVRWTVDEEGNKTPVQDHPRVVRQSAWMFNSIMNKHADLMDNFPDPVIMAREKGDEPAAKMLSDIVPVVLDNCNFEQTFSDNGWDKLCFGTSAYGITWDPDALNGLGDIAVKPVDVLDMYWEPGIQNLQDSQNIFILSLVEKKLLEQEYPQTVGKLTGTVLNIKEYHYDDQVDNTDKALTVDWYYKVRIGGKQVLQYCKWVDDIILYSSEDDEEHPEYRTMGFYNHGRYPFVLDTLYREKGTPAGYGYVDVMKDTQEYIDQLGTDILENAAWGTKPRFFAKDTGSINELELHNLDQQIVHVSGSLSEDNIRVIDHKPLDGNYLNVYQAKIDELKETSGNRDFSQGSTSSGVTSGSAIAALQEAGSKGSRDMIKGTYRAFSEICELVVELIRQFYDTPRTFRIIGDAGQPEYVTFDNAGMQALPVDLMGQTFQTKEPVFDIVVKAQKSNPYSRLSQNELALQFYQLGFFNPELADQALATVDMMDFEGKEKVQERIQQNGLMFQQIQQMQQTMMQMAQLMADQTGDTRIMDALAMQQGGEPMPQGGASSAGAQGTSAADKMRERASHMTEVR